jgi:Predicted transcriptional regulator
MQKVVTEMLDYSPLWEYMKENGITQYYLLKKVGIDNKTLANMKKDGNITLLTVEKLCKALKCTPNDIVRFTDD